jgi:hypothetical protein
VKPIHIGQNASDQPLYITPELRRSTHMHIIGGSGTGKSKFLEWIIRKDIRERQGLCLLDWHGTLYQDVLSYCAQLRVGTPSDWRKLILINPSKPDYITGYNPFVGQSEDISVQVQRRIDATIRPWGITDTNQMPTFERVCRLLYTFAVEQGETLPNAIQLLQFEKPELRDYAIRVISDPWIRDQWQQLQMMKTFRDWREFVLSTENRLGRFLASRTIRRFMGLTEGNINLMEAMDKQKIVLVNLGSSGYLDREAARVFASLFLNEFFETAMLRAQLARERGEAKPKTFVLYMDEFQEYITDDIGAMLDQVRKGGLHMVLAHQHLGHLADNPRLLQSVLTNARIRAVFGGLPFDEACALANEMFLPDLNTRQIKKAYYHTIHLYDEQTRIVRSHSASRGSSTTHSEMTGSGSSWGSVSSTSSGTSSTTGFSGPSTAGNPNAVEGWFSQGETRSSVTSNAYSDAYSDFSAAGFATSDSVSETEGETVVPVWVPIPVQELGSEAEWSLEEKRSKVAEMLKTQQQRHCFIKLDTEKTQPLLIPFVRDYSHRPADLLEYEKKVYAAQGALPAAEVDRLIEESATKFLNAAREPVDAMPIIDIDAEVVEVDKTPTVRQPRTRPKKPTQNPYAAVPPLSTKNQNKKP